MNSAYQGFLLGVGGANLCNSYGTRLFVLFLKIPWKKRASERTVD